jgi:hypothetical protein
MKSLWRISIALLFIGLIAGCSASMPVRHLSSDVCLVMPESTTKAEVLSFLGEPDRRQHQPEGEETWFYYKKNESFLRKLPVVGPRLGWSNYEIVTVSFVGEQVRTCIYRQLEPEEFMDPTP